MPFDRPSSAGAIEKPKKQKKESPNVGKKSWFFNRKKNKEEGEVHVKPRCFVEQPLERRRSESPEPSERSSSAASKHPFKLRQKTPKEDGKHGGPMWRAKVSQASLPTLLVY